MIEILDDESFPVKNTKFGNRSFWYFILEVTTILVIFFANYFFKELLDNLIVNGVMTLLILIFFLSSIAGFINAIRSLLTKEKVTIKRIIGGFGNFLTFGLLILMILTDILDLLKLSN